MHLTRRSLMFVGLLCLLVSATTSVAFAQDPENGKVLWEQEVWQCSACHGQSGEGVFGAPLAGRGEGDRAISLEAWIEQVRTPRRRMPAFSEAQVSDGQLTDMHAYIVSLPVPEEFGFQRIELPDDAHPGQVLVVEKRCVACHSITGVENTRFPSGRATPVVENTIRQLRTPFRNMPAFSDAQVSDEEATLITEFMLTQVPAEAMEATEAEEEAPVEAPAAPDIPSETLSVLMGILFFLIELMLP